MSEEFGPRREGVQIRSAVAIQGVDFPDRTIEIVAVPYETETIVPEHPDGSKLIRELVERGAFDGIEQRNGKIAVNREHQRMLTFGKVVEWEPAYETGLRALVKASRTPLGDESLQLADDGILKASVGMVFRRSDALVRDGLRRVRRAFMDHLALTVDPAYAGTDVLRVASADEVRQALSTPNLDAVLTDPFFVSVLEGHR